MTINVNTLVLIGLGGMVGAVFRYLISGWLKRWNTNETTAARTKMMARSCTSSASFMGCSPQASYLKIV